MRVDAVREALQLAYDLGPRLVLVDAGRIGTDPNHPTRQFLVDALTGLARHADRIGSRLALISGHEPADRVAEFLAQLGAGSLGVSLDPALSIMHDHDPHGFVKPLHSLLLHVHARDAIPGRADRLMQEAVLGKGYLDWSMFLASLAEVEYCGWLTLKRITGTNPAIDIAAGLEFLRRLGV
jgi:sugar phosphate isomerase/epimerase